MTKTMKKRTSESSAFDPVEDIDVPTHEATAWAHGMPVGTHGPDVEAPIEIEPTATVATAPSRYEALDLARGFAICLMILSHGVKGLMMFEQMPAWGLVPIHLITKFSSSLFILVFGITLAVSFVPHIGTPEWPKKRKKLMVRGLLVLFWYKALTILEMSHLFGPDEIWAALMYKTFPIYVEILGFYAIMLMWIPFVLPLWKASHAVIRLMLPVAFLALSAWLPQLFDFTGHEILQAILVEHPNYYTWGQLSRAPYVFLGLNIGWLVQMAATTKNPRLLPFSVLGATSLTLFGLFFFNAGDKVQDHFVQIAMNAGKHPPEMQFMLFSLGGAFLILALTLGGGKTLSSVLGMMTTIGKNSLQAFVFHIVVLFTFYRYLFDYFHKVEYNFALFLSLLLILMTYVWVKVSKWVRANS